MSSRAVSSWCMALALAAFAGAGASWSRRAPAPPAPTGLFVDPEGLAIGADDLLYVADEDGGAFVCVTLDGVERARISSFSARAPIATRGGGVAVLGSGRFVAVAPWCGVVELELTSPTSARVVREYGEDLDGSEGLVVDARGRVYIAEEDVRQVRVYDPEGRPLAVWKLADEPEHLLIVGDEMYVVHAKADRLARHVLATGALLGHVGEDAGLDTPDAVALGPDGLLYVTDQGNDRIVVLSRPDAQHPDGRVVRTIGGPGSAPGEFRQPEDLVFTRAGLLVVADGNNGRLQVLRRDGTPVSIID